MDIKAYLQRVGIAATTVPSLVALSKLHSQHLLSIPFESLSIHCGEKIILDPALLYEKIVVKRRGGFCYENNGLFLWVLQVLGYNPRVLSARVKNPVTQVFGPPYDHMILTVELEGRRWLCDVGYGEGIKKPFPIEAGWEEDQDGRRLRIREEQEEWFLEVKEDEGWKILYKFTLKECHFEDFKSMCEYQQTSPNSIFYNKSFCSLQLAHGRVTYMGNRLIHTDYTAGGGQVKTTQHVTDEEIPDVLRDTFGIVLSNKLIPKDEEIVTERQ
ncbi:arylamine N-acetyltransferase 2-like [Pelodytes ibericus]